MIDLIKHKKDLAEFLMDWLENIPLDDIKEGINEYIDNQFESSEDKQYRQDQDEEQDAFDRELNG